jgi:copper transporter 1
MYMIWNTDIIDTCIVFRWWHIRTHTHFVLTLLAILSLGILYEYLRVFQRKLDFHVAQSLISAKGKNVSRGRDRSNGPTGRTSPHGLEDVDHEELGLLSGRILKVQPTGLPVPPVSRALRALVYGVSVFLSFFLMLVFMTYNAYYILAVVVGATLGHYIFGCTMNIDAALRGNGVDKGIACH